MENPASIWLTLFIAAVSGGLASTLIVLGLSQLLPNNSFKPTPLCGALNSGVRPRMKILGRELMKFQLLCITVLFVSGCASTEITAPSATTAELAMDIESRSSGGGIGQNWHVWKYQDATCQTTEKGVRVARKRKDRPMESIHLPAGRPITLAFWYIEADFGQNRECSYTWTFTPQMGETYRAKLDVSPRVQCLATLTDAAGATVETTNPENSCVIGVYRQRVRNGEPATIKYKINVQHY